MGTARSVGTRRAPPGKRVLTALAGHKVVIVLVEWGAPPTTFGALLALAERAVGLVAAPWLRIFVIGVIRPVRGATLADWASLALA